jgi:hypothetical protein
MVRAVSGLAMRRSFDVAIGLEGQLQLRSGLIGWPQAAELTDIGCRDQCNRHKWDTDTVTDRRYPIVD